MGQAFALISSPQIDDIIRRRDNVITALMRDPMDYDAKITELFWRALSRLPSKDEVTKLAAVVRSAPEDKRRAAMEDIAWSLVNAKEFVLRR